MAAGQTLLPVVPLSAKGERQEPNKGSGEGEYETT